MARADPIGPASLRPGARLLRPRAGPPPAAQVHRLGTQGLPGRGTAPHDGAVREQPDRCDGRARCRTNDRSRRVLAGWRDRRRPDVRRSRLTRGTFRPGARHRGMERVWPLIVALIVAGCGAHAAGPGPAGSVSGTNGAFAAQATPASLAAHRE